MADRYLDSGAASSASPYESTSTAALTLVTFDALALAVDETIWVKDTHSFSATVAQTFTPSSNVTAAKPQRVICVSDFGTNSTPVTTPSAAERSSANAAQAFEGSWFLHGLIIENTSGLGGGRIEFGANIVGPHNIEVSCCRLIPGSAALYVVLGGIANTGNDETQITINNSEFYFKSTTGSIRVRHGQHRLNNISIPSAASHTPTSLFTAESGIAFDLRVENSDLTGKAITNLFNSSNNCSGVAAFRNILLQSGTVLCTDNINAPGLRFIADDITIGTTYVPFYRRYFSGQVWHEATIKANDTADRLYLVGDTDGYSIKLEGTANSTYWQPLYSDWIHIPIDDTATAITPYAEILALGDAAAALTDRECWIEVDAKTVAGTNNHQATRYNDSAALVAAGTDQAAGTITFTGHGYTTPRTHKLALGSAVTPTQKGFIRIRVALAKNTSIFIGKVGVA